MEASTLPADGATLASDSRSVYLTEGTTILSPNDALTGPALTDGLPQSTQNNAALAVNGSVAKFSGLGETAVLC